jgi:hypothetical protein
MSAFRKLNVLAIFLQLFWLVPLYGTFTLNMHEGLPLEQLARSPVLVGQNFGLR